MRDFLCGKHRHPELLFDHVSPVVQMDSKEGLVEHHHEVVQDVKHDQDDENDSGDVALVLRPAIRREMHVAVVNGEQEALVD